MNMKSDLIKQMGEDLQLYKFIDETDSEYLNRLIYSAIAVWMLHILRDRKIEDNYNRIGVSKKYITRKISKIVSEYSSLFPSFNNFLNGLTETELAIIIRKNYECAGYIVPVRFDEYVILSSVKEFRVTNRFKLVRNNFDFLESKVVGLGVFTENYTEEEVQCIDNIFYIPKLDAKTWTSDYIRHLKWSNAVRLGENVQFFNPNSKKSFNQCWEEKFPQNSEITLYKTNNWDYGFARKDSSNYIGIKIPEWLIGTENNVCENLFDNDVRRFMYGLKAIYKNNANIILEKKTDHFELKLLNALPLRELTALKFFSWNKKCFLDKCNYDYIIPYEFIEPVKYMLNKLLIIIEER